MDETAASMASARPDTLQLIPGCAQCAHGHPHHPHGDRSPPCPVSHCSLSPSSPSPPCSSPSPPYQHWQIQWQAGLQYVKWSNNINQKHSKTTKEQSECMETEIECNQISTETKSKCSTTTDQSRWNPLCRVPFYKSIKSHLYSALRRKWIRGT